MNAPIVCSLWELDTNPTGGSLTFVLCNIVPPPPPVPLLGGEILIDMNAIQLPHLGQGRHGFVIPPLPGVAGLTVFLQGFRIDPVGTGFQIVFLNAIDAVIGH